MSTNRVKALIAAPALAAAVIGGAAIGLAGPANASTSLNYYDDSSTTGNFYAPTTYASPATTYVPWGAWINGSY